MASFAQKITESAKRQNIVLVTGGRDHTGRAAWYYLQVDAHQRARFERVVKSGALTLSEYGTVLLSGYGDAPGADAQSFMRTNYGFEG